jgi:Mg-chelatase subunit ChlD
MDITKYQQQTPIKQGTKLRGGTAFEQRVRQAQQVEIPVAELPNRIVLALDCSSSMSGQSIQILREAADSFIEESIMDGQTAVGMQSFPTGTLTPLTNAMLQLKLQIYGLQATGGTPMRNCLVTLPTNFSCTRVVLISDGAPTDWHSWEEDLREVLKPYIDMGIPVDTIHAQRSKDGEEILRAIAEATGGIFIKFQDIKNLRSGLKYLSPRKRLMLTAGKAHIEGATEVKL